MSTWTTASALVVGCAVVLCIGRRVLKSRPHPLPPGPPGLPFVGNVLGVDTRAPWTTYDEWARTYGDIVYSRLFRVDIIIINSEKIARDLLEKRSRKYSDRPNVGASEMCGFGFNSVILPYGDRWRLHRRFFHQTFRPDAVPRFLPLQHQKACHLLRQLFHTPEQLEGHVSEYTVSVTLNSTYDYDPASRKDQLVEITTDMLNAAELSLRPDIAIISGVFPLLLRLPSWLPGMSFKKEMAAARALSKQFLERPFEYSLQRMPSGSVAPSMVHDALRHIEEKGIPPDESWMEALKEAAGTSFLAATESSHSVLMTFFLMMVVHPEVQEKAQVQIDAVVGKTRLPTMDDRPLLPFIDAILRESLRYSPVIPLSVPHAALEDDVYDGFYIPKGAILMTNLWTMAHDESKYPNSHAFIPERFLNDDGSLKPNDVDHLAYGFGRRVCVGRYFADASLWGVISKVLAVFKTLKPLDENGLEIPVEPKYSTGVAVRPLPFGFRIVPRFPGMGAEELEKLIADSSIYVT